MRTLDLLYKLWGFMLQNSFKANNSKWSHEGYNNNYNTIIPINIIKIVIIIISNSTNN